MGKRLLFIHKGVILARYSVEQEIFDVKIPSVKLISFSHCIIRSIMKKKKKLKTINIKKVKYLHSSENFPIYDSLK